MNKRIDLTGFKKNNITVIEFHSVGKRRAILWRCLCVCGKEIIKNTNDIRHSKSKSCIYCCNKGGNYFNHNSKIKHGLAYKHPLYGVWKNIKQRCYNANNQDYKFYGKIRIIVCDDWKNDFGKFYKWAISNGWEKGLVTDRIDSNGNYSPDNCRFITKSENSKKVWADNPGMSRGENHHDATTTESQVILIKNLLLQNVSKVSIAKIVNVSLAVVSQISLNKTWKHIQLSPQTPEKSS